MNKHWQASAKVMTAVENKYRAKIYRSLRHQHDAAIEYVKANGVQQAMASLDLIVPMEPLMSVIKGIYKDAGLTLATYTYKDLQRRTKEEKAARLGFSQSWIDRVLGYFRLFLLNKSVIPITQTTKRRLMEILQEAQTEGWGTDRTVRQLRDTDLTRQRAKVIVRTETVRAANYGSMVGAAQMGLKLNKEWLSAGDNRVRPDHKGLNGAQVPFEEKFVDRDGNRLMFPGDPEAAPDATIMCRCVLLYHPVRDANDRLIPFTYNIV